MSEVTKLPWLADLEKLLGREPGTLPTKDGKFIAEYFELKAPARSFVGDTQEEALRKLYEYLVGQGSPKPA